jgi:hypothetical protein
LLLPRKLKFFINYFLGPVLFIGIALSIYRQIQHQPNAAEKWHAILNSLDGPQSWRLYGALVLMLLNWGIESLKWQVLLSHLLKMPFIRAFRSVVSGVAFTMITPNRMGEFIGRVFYVPDGNRIRAAALTLVGSASQLIITLFGGAIGLLVLRHYLISHTTQLQGVSILWLNGLFAGTVFILLIILLFYFRISWLIKIIDKIPQFSGYAYYIQPLEEVGTRELSKILLFSGLRYSVFIIQYWLLFKLFNVQVLSWQLISAVTVLFLVLAVVPTIALAELGIRSKASIALFSIFSTNTIGILAATAAIWLINIIFPAIAGSLFVLGVKLFGKE